jgi:hypothetical protein
MPRTDALTPAELHQALTAINALLDTPAIQAAMFEETRVQLTAFRSQLHAGRPELPRRNPAGEAGR